MKIKQILQTKLIPIALVALTLLILLNITAFAEDSWTTVASMSRPRCDHQTEVIDGKIYAIGGYGSGTSTEVYDPDADTWTTLAPMSTSRQHVQTEVIDGKIYTIGGRDEHDFISSTEVYDPNTNTWTTLSSMSQNRGMLQTEVIDGKIYAIGGRERYDTLSSTEVYDPNTDTWTTLSSMSEDRRDFCTEVIDGKIYAIGGHGTTGGASSSVEVYDPDTNTWTSLASMSTPRDYHITATIDGKIYAIGGQGTSGLLSSAEVYDPVTDTWTPLSSMSEARSMIQMEVVDGKIYVVGGYYTQVYLATTEVYDPVTDSWTTLASMTEARSAFTTELLDGKIYVIGGTGNSSVCLSSVERYTVSSSTTPDDPTDGNALLRITMITGESKEYDMSGSAVNAFISWYNSGGASSPSYSIAKNFNIGSLSGRTDNIAFKKIAFFEVMAYNTSSTPDTNTKTALLKVTMATDDVMEYEMNAAEISAFESWYDGGASGTPAYSINKNFNIGPFASRTDYLAYDMISDYEIMTF